MIIGNKEFDFENEFYVMGILNVTPDSFSDGGQYNDLDKALFQAEKMIMEGAAILDVGGESTRPGHTRIAIREEIDRVCPVIEKIKQRFDIPVSLDTYKSQVASAGIESGADFINDIWGLKWDDNIAKVIADAGVPCCLMHNRDNCEYKYFAMEAQYDLSDSITLARNAGIQEDCIVLDPGIGFAKTYEQNLIAMKGLRQYRQFGYPVMLATSRKSMIGITLDLPVDERLEGTLATSVIGLMAGCSIFRVHDVKENMRALKMTQAIMRAQY